MNLRDVEKKRTFDQIQTKVFLETVKCNINNKKMKTDIVDMYRKVYKVKAKTKDYEWRKNSKDEWFLFDNIAQRINVWLDENGMTLIPPLGCTKKEKSVKPFQLYFDTIPKLTKDVLLHIFSFIPSHELTEFRTVCKGWNRIITNHAKFWELSITYNPPCWQKFTGFKLYIQHMFLNVNVRNEMQVINFLIDNKTFLRQCIDPNIGPDSEFPYIYLPRFKQHLLSPGTDRLIINHYRTQILKKK